MNKRLVLLALVLMLVAVVTNASQPSSVVAYEPSTSSQETWDTQFIPNTETITVYLGDESCTCVGGTAIPEPGAGRHPAAQFYTEGCKKAALLRLCSQGLYK